MQIEQIENKKRRFDASLITPMIPVDESENGIEVLIATGKSFSTQAYRVDNPHNLPFDFAFANEVEDKIVQWVADKKFKMYGSDWIRAHFDAWRMSGSKLGFDDWWRYMCRRCGIKTDV